MAIDRVFRGDCSTRQVYEEGAREIALSVVSGINCEYKYSYLCCFLVPSTLERQMKVYSNFFPFQTFSASIFAYGQTSSGKTYTMNGITEYTVADIFDYIHRVLKITGSLISLFHLKCLIFTSFMFINWFDYSCYHLILLQHEERAFVVKFSAIEIYNEAVRDLLCTDNTQLRLLDDPEVRVVFLVFHSLFKNNNNLPLLLCLTWYVNEFLHNFLVIISGGLLWRNSQRKPWGIGAI